MAAPDIDLSRAAWRTSTYSNNGGACVEVATNLPGIVAVRDSKDPAGPALIFSTDNWQFFIHTFRGQQSTTG
ncbi:MAG: DUF397 domain-containing protein [Streptosporangiaceae bacterium]